MGVQKARGGQKAYKKNRKKSGDLFFFFFFFFLETLKNLWGRQKMSRGARNGNVTPLMSSQKNSINSQIHPHVHVSDIRLCIGSVLKGGGGGGGVGANGYFFVKLDFEIAVDQQTKTSDQTFEGVPDPNRQTVPAGQPRPYLVQIRPNLAKYPDMPRTHILCALLVASGHLNSYMKISSRLDKK